MNSLLALSVPNLAQLAELLSGEVLTSSYTNSYFNLRYNIVNKLGNADYSHVLIEFYSDKLMDTVFRIVLNDDFGYPCEISIYGTAAFKQGLIYHENFSQISDAINYFEKMFQVIHDCLIDVKQRLESDY